MNHNQLLFFLVLSAFLFVICFYLIRVFVAAHRRKVSMQEQGTTEVGFVVSTFHELVSKLKEKEKELEDLRRRAEDRASSVELYNENIFRSVPSGLIGLDRDLQITKANPVALHILEKPEEIVGMRHDEVFRDPVRSMLEAQDVIERAEVRYLTDSGRRKWLGLTLSPLRDGAGAVIGRLLVFTDLTELKAFQTQMELRERLSTLGEMSAGIAHELRNPMAVISGYTKILMKKADGASRPAVEAIAKEVAVMDRIIGDFLSFARPPEPVVSTVDLAELVHGIVGTLRPLNEAVRMIVDRAALPVIEADEVMIRQALSNLLQNAVEAIPEGGEVGVRAETNGELRIVVSDTGHGVPENIRDKIFLPFYSTKERGTGLGLSIVHKIAVAHGGSVSIETGDGETRFVLQLPRKLVVSS